MLQREDLAPIAQRALREQADLREAVEHDALRLDPLDRLEDALGRLAELEVGRIEQALLLLLVEQALRRHQLVDVIRRRGPAVRLGALAQLLLGLGQGDVEAALARLRARRAGTGSRSSSCRCRGSLRAGTPAPAPALPPGRRRAPRRPWPPLRLAYPSPSILILPWRRGDLSAPLPNLCEERLPDQPAETGLVPERNSPLRYFAGARFGLPRCFAQSTCARATSRAIIPIWRPMPTGLVSAWRICRHCRSSRRSPWR